jgi:hypothetical protein
MTAHVNRPEEIVGAPFYLSYIVFSEGVHGSLSALLASVAYFSIASAAESEVDPRLAHSFRGK